MRFCGMAQSGACGEHGIVVNLDAAACGAEFHLEVQRPNQRCRIFPPAGRFQCSRLIFEEDRLATEPFPSWSCGDWVRIVPAAM